MLSTYLLFFDLIYSIYSPVVSGIYFPFTNCYESFSNPKLVFKLYLHTPSGPDYMLGIVSSRIYYDERKREKSSWREAHHFKRVKGACDKSDIIYTTDEKYFEKMDLVIRLYLTTVSKQFAHIHYEFADGFINNNYTLIDEFENYAISTQVMYSKDQLFPKAIHDLKEAEHFLRSIPHYNHICVVNKFSHQLLINHKYDFFIPEGYVVGIIVELKYNQGHINRFEYNAFECDIDDKFSYNPALFVTEGDATLTFKATYVNSDDQNEKLLKEAYFSINNINQASIYSDLMSMYNKIYLIESDRPYIPCKCRNRQTVSETKEVIIFHHEKFYTVKVDKKVERYKRTSDFGKQPCHC